MYFVHCTNTVFGYGIVSTGGLCARPFWTNDGGISNPGRWEVSGRDPTCIMLTYDALARYPQHVHVYF